VINYISSRALLILIRTIVASAFVALGIWTFGNALIFDRVFYVCLVVSALLARKEPNVLGIIVILFITRTIDELSWAFLLDLPWIGYKALIYAILGGAFWLLRDDPRTSYIPIIIWLMCIASECYWAFTGYNAPDIYWYLISICITLLARHLIFLRGVLSTKYFGVGDVDETHLDWYIYHHICLSSLLLHACVLVEFIFRHVLKINSLFFYTITPYLLHTLGLLTLYMVLESSYKHMLPKQLTA